jgi:hypothetical protein
MRCAGRTKRGRPGDGCTAEQRNGGALMECAGQKGRRGSENDEDDEFVLMEHHLREEKEGSLETGKL